MKTFEGKITEMFWNARIEADTQTAETEVTE